MKRMNRRHFIGQSVCLAALATSPKLSAVQPFKRSGAPRLFTSIAAYSFRQYFKNATHRQSKNIKSADRISLFDFIDFCADQSCEGTELTAYYFPPSVDSDFLIALKRHAFLRGIAISGTAVGNSFTHENGAKRSEQIAYVKRWIDHAQLMGAPHIRVFAGGKGALDSKTAMRNCIRGLEECGQYAADRGVFLGVENHGGIVAEADPLLEIIRAVSSSWVGISLDTGNFHTEDPYGDIAKCAPYAVNVQLKVEIRARGQRKVKSDLGRLIQILKDANYQGFIALEHEANEDPWQSIPGYLAEIRRLAKS